MARVYQMPADIREKEKIVGGIFTLTQFIFLILAAVSGIGLGLGTFAITSNAILSLILIVIGALPFIPFAFIKVRKYGDIELWQFLIIKLKFKKLNRVYLNINENFREKGTE